MKWKNVTVGVSGVAAGLGMGLLFNPAPIEAPTINPPTTSVVGERLVVVEAPPLPPEVVEPEPIPSPWQCAVTYRWDERWK